MARSGAGEYLRATGIVAVVTAACLLLRSRLAVIDVAMLLLLGVVAAAATHRRGPALVASLLSIVVFDLLFVPPFGTLHVFDTAYYLTFVVMLVVAATMSELTSRIRAQREAAAARERRTAALYAMETDLGAAADLEGIREATARHLGRLIAGTALLRLVDDRTPDEMPALPDGGVCDDTDVRVAAAWAWTRRERTGWGTRHAGELPAMLAPLVSASGPIGLAVLVPRDPDRAWSEEDETTLTEMLSLATGALERRQLAGRHERARRDVEAERLRTALLSSLSHDLRTPLAGIEGSASSLLDGMGSLAPGVQRELLEGIISESHRMTRLVGNLLNMVRVETGTLAVQKSWQPLEEPLGVALLRMEDRFGAHPVTTALPNDLPMVPIDELLIEQVFLNLLENAVRYTPPGTPIEITACRDGDQVLVEVADRGPGVPRGEEEAMFERFHRGAGAAEGAADAGAGAGLGLTICRGIIQAHGGRIWMEPRAGGGTAVRFTLPGAATMPAAPAAEAAAG